jgi:hypothetical protein
LASRRLAVEALEDRCVPSFLAPVTSPGGGIALAVGDFNHDGRDDVATLSGTIVSSGSLPSDVVAISGKASVSLSKGDGTFQKPSTLAGAKGYYLNSFIVQDRNGDGNLDVVARTFDRRHDPVGGIPETSITATAYDTVWFGKGDGTFARVSITSYPHTSTWPWGWPPRVVSN